MKAPATVYFTDMHTVFGSNLPTKLERLILKAGFESLDLKGKFVAVKVHFGEPGNLAFLRPNYARTVCDLIKRFGGKPFVTDCNTLYVGGRKNALDHLDTAYANGYNPFATGVHTIIADGLKGTDDIEVPVDGGRYVKAAKIGRALMDADIIISLNHFKGHELTGFGGALKNIGMGCGSRAGKMEMHSAGKPTVDTKLCVGCGQCHKICAHGAPVIADGKARIDQERCVGCGRCIGVCPRDAVVVAFDEANDILNGKIAEYTWAVLHGRPHFHISLAIDIAPFCDCHSENDIPIVPDVGMFASFDPVAIDRACADAVNRQPVTEGSLLAKSLTKQRDHFGAVSPTTHWESCLEHAESLGIGTQAYTLETL
ncbi:MAG: DUF362 domain-containing protein [Kiritimatiellia bacterium]